jgi:3-oxoacyl-[acyl-carrier protein] reductase
VSVAVVTGPSRGIGRATALELARRGSDVVLVGRASAALDETQERVAEAGVRSEILSCDLAISSDVVTAGRRIVERFGAPDAVVHNGAVIHRAPIEATTGEAWDEQLAVNLRAPFLLTRELLPALRAAGRGRIVLVGSISSTLGAAGAAAYCASKWALVGFMKSLAEELSGSGVMASAVLPGSVATRMLEGSGFEPRMTAEDVAKTLVHYALDAPVAHNGAVVEMFGV